MRREPVRLSALATAVDGELTPSGVDAEVVDVTHNSRDIQPGWLFVAIRGSSRDGRMFIGDAEQRGAVAVCVDTEVPDGGVPRLRVADCRRALPQLAAAVHRDPSTRLKVVGVTGTNGKTTVTYLIESILGTAGVAAGVVGTVGARIGGVDIPQARTTPESSDLQRLFRRMLDEGTEVGVLEVSSHALALGRVDGTVFEVAAFTNLSQDHLDFHPTMNDYFAAKRSLFEPARAKRAVVWVDDPRGDELAAGLDGVVPVRRVGTGQSIRAERPEASLSGTRFTLVIDDERFPVELRLAGDFNVANALVAAACAVELGVRPALVAAGLSAVDRIPGRFESVDAGQPFAVIVDYAHSPEAISAMVAQVRPLTSGRITVVVGAGGDRDQAKRPLMGAAAASADRVIVTSDNPRSEDPIAIAAAVVTGARDAGATDLVEEPDRRRAIRMAIDAAAAGDVVLILGKGHETSQELADGIVVPFDDRTVAMEELMAGAAS